MTVLLFHPLINLQVSQLMEYVVQHTVFDILWKPYSLALKWDYMSLSICNSNCKIANIVM